jgi:hypothetical protein
MEEPQRSVAQLLTIARRVASQPEGTFRAHARMVARTAPAP